MIRTIKEFNAITQEEIIIEREETAEEKANREAYLEAELKRQEEEESKLAARSRILERLGITEEEAKLLLG